MKKEQLDMRICDCVERAENTQTYREFMTETMEHLDYYPIEPKDFDKLSEESLNELLDFLDVKRMCREKEWKLCEDFRCQIPCGKCITSCGMYRKCGYCIDKSICEKAVVQTDTELFKNIGCDKFECVDLNCCPCEDPDCMKFRSCRSCAYHEYCENGKTIEMDLDRLQKSIKWLENIRDHATIDPMLYAGRHERAMAAVDALEKQIPKKPIVKHYEEVGGKPYIKTSCPAGCRIQVCDWDNYCCKCGQRLDWSGEDAEVKNEKMV